MYENYFLKIDEDKSFLAFVGLLELACARLLDTARFSHFFLLNDFFTTVSEPGTGYLEPDFEWKEQHLN